MNSDKLVNILIEIEFSGQQLLDENEILAASKSRSTLIRSLVAKILCYYPEDFAIMISLNFLKDKNPDVRSSAAIGLDNSSNKKAYDLLKSTFYNDKSAIVRAYAGCAFINNSHFKKDCILALEDFLSKQKNYLVRTICYGELYKKYPNEKYLNKITQCLQSEIYQTRCAVINTLTEILDDNNAHYIFSAVNKILEKETVDIVRESAFVLLNKASALSNPPT